MTTTTGRTETHRVVADLVAWLETGEQDDLFAADAFADLTFPEWRIQESGADGLVEARRRQHGMPGRVRVERVDETAAGFVVAFEERWSHEGQDWYCRELIRADVAHGQIVDLALYCTGDWDEEVQARHAREVRLIRP